MNAISRTSELDASFAAREVPDGMNRYRDSQAAEGDDNQSEVDAETPSVRAGLSNTTELPQGHNQQPVYGETGTGQSEDIKQAHQGAAETSRS